MTDAITLPIAPAGPGTASVAANVGETRQEGSEYFWFQRGVLLANSQQYAEALVDFEATLALFPTLIEALLYQGVCRLHLRQPAAALASCDRILTLVPHHTQALLFRGVALQQLGQYRQAYAVYDQALEGFCCPLQQHWWHHLPSLITPWQSLWNHILSSRHSVKPLS
ncbi:hypothetical protein XM38_013830 [Halomicronema hongdechloris C2206]|uniref:Uncharacterized protein n=1 Tax=Halomicronema hongdechloris C2206 TaxID=1641165 RepID=A0A1Z3HJE5_9CYAN|nr:tetratricopeptide repeat protein [Halomicronema hongdechloris]ASC70444.1 hypothetical protein XM38_013830 [Halomicronema hongdechloris C2206]